MIVERLRKARRYKDALAWAELYGFQDLRLVDVALVEYRRARRPGDAVALAWRAYREISRPPTGKSRCPLTPGVPRLLNKLHVGCHGGHGVWLFAPT